MTKQVNDLYTEMQETHLKLIKLNHTKRFDLDYFEEIAMLEDKQTIINNELKKLGWFFDFERFILVGLKE